MTTHRAIGPAILLVAAIACTLDPSSLGELPDTSATTGPTTTAVTSTSTGDSSSATTNPTTSMSTGDPTTSMSTGDPTTSTSESDTDPPATPWDAYCEYVASHGGTCDPEVDEFPDLKYPGRGYIVHEWGTDTIVAGSDGVPLRGLHHEEEDLPGFVYDRLDAGQLAGSVSVHVKMETPVTYFYADTPRSVAVSVGFAGGVFSHWYPAVARFEPYVAAPGAIPKLVDYDDPVLNPHFPFASEVCIGLYRIFDGGLLDWGTVQVLDRNADLPVPDAPLDETTWAHARAVDANLLEIAGVPGADTPQHERFLFYRGVGNFPLPLTITAPEGDALEIDNASAIDVARIFVIRVDATRGAFVEWSDGVPSGQSIAGEAPSLDSAPSLELFVNALDQRITEALDGAGLYHDEAQAMVATWRRQWFTTPGVRVLYLVPQAWTDGSIPLSLDPAPDSITRVMMIRSEVLTPALELADVDAAGLLASPDTAQAGHDYFLALGRFAEPRLRRAAALLGDPSYLGSLLEELLSADTRVATGE